MKNLNDKEYLSLKGGGGGGSSGGSSAATYTNRPDNLRSTDSFEILLGLGSGRWKGLTNGLKSLYINDVPLSNADGTSNFKDITAIFADGDPTQTQTVSFKLGGGGGITSVNTVLANNETSGPGPWVSGATTVPNADFIDFRFVVQQLYHSTENGMLEATATIEIQMRPQGSSTWINPLSIPAVPPSYDPGTGSYIITQPPVTIDPSPQPIYGSGGGTYRMYINPDRVDVGGFMLSRPASSMSGGMPGGGGYNYNDEGFGDYAGGSVTGSGGTPLAAGTNGYLTINGKTMSSYVKELRIAVPKAGAYTNKTWEFRARLIEKGHEYINPGASNQEELVRTVLFESATSVIKEVLGADPAWRGLAWMQVYGKASDQLSGFPNIRGIFDTKMVKTPVDTVFDPETRVYTGAIWDGTYSISYTNDPAWCIKDLIEDPISGIAAISPGATLDKWDTLDVSKYCSELVSDGKGGQEPRYSLNFRLDTEMNAEELVQYVAGAFNGLCVDTGNGKWRMRMDKPETPVTTFTLDNINGEFQYNHTDIDTRYNDITLIFLNQDTNYQEDRLRVYDQTHIDIFGRKPTTIVALGATSRQEVLRRGVMRLRTSINENKIVKFVTNRQGKLLEPLQNILIADSSLGYLPPTGSTPLSDIDANDNRTTSRIESMNLARDQITLGRSIRLEPGVTYKIKLTIPNVDYSPETLTQPTSPDWKSPTIAIERTLLNNSTQRGDTYVLYLDAPLPVNTPVNAVIALDAPGLPTLPVTYRIISIEPSEEENVSITAMLVDTGKYNAADSATTTSVGAWIATGRTSGGGAGSIDGSPAINRPTVPTWGMFNLVSYINAGQTQRTLNVNWIRPTNSTFIKGYKVEHKLDFSAWTTVAPLTDQTVFEFTDPIPGHHQFRVTAIDLLNGTSAPLIGGIDVPAIDAPITLPPHTYGAYADRPSTGLVTGQQYTSTDLVPIVTEYWDSGWIILSGAGVDVGSGSPLPIYDSGSVTPTTPVPRTDVITPIGIAAGIASQGDLATQNAADLISGIDGPVQSTTFKYDYLGTAETGQFPRDLTLKLFAPSGQITSGITWSYTVLTGTVNTYTSTSGAHSISGGGTGTFSVSSLGSSTASIQIKGTYAGRDYFKTIYLNKDIAAPPQNSGGGGGGGPTTIASKSSGWSGPSNSTYINSTGSTPLVGTMPTGKTTATITVELEFEPADAGMTADWEVQLKIMRDISGTPTQVGSVQTSYSHEEYFFDLPNYWFMTNAGFSFTFDDTGLTAGNTYTWRIYSRVNSTGYGTTAHSITGSVTVTA